MYKSQLYQCTIFSQCEMDNDISVKWTILIGWNKQSHWCGDRIIIPVVYTSHISQSILVFCESVLILMFQCTTHMRFIWDEHSFSTIFSGRIVYSKNKMIWSKRSEHLTEIHMRNRTLSAPMSCRRSCGSVCYTCMY